MTTNRKPSEILRAIGERIGRPEAWTTGASARTIGGIGVGPFHQQATCWCWLGALDATIGYDSPDRKGIVALMAMGAGEDVAQFNDTHTHAEVLAANARAVQLAEEAGE